MRTFWIVWTVVAFVLQFASGLTLGRSWSAKPEARRLVTHGLYRRIRNPLYFFNLLFLTGLFMAVGYPRLFLSFFVLIPIQIARAKAEAKVLEKAFGNQYRRYRQGTWF